MKRLKLSQIVTDAGTQSRVSANEDIVDDYAERMTAGDKFPPVVVFHDGSQYFLADGFHRVLARQRNKLKDVFADIRKGTRQDALKFSLSANRLHGLHRTNADKRFAVSLALKEFSQMSDRAIADMCGVGKDLVASIRPKQLAENASSYRTGRDGKTRKLPKSLEPTDYEVATECAVAVMDAPRVVAELVEEFSEPSSNGKASRHKEHGRYEDWPIFRQTCEEISEHLKTLKKLRVDADHKFPAREAAGRLVNALKQIIDSMGD